MRCPRCQGKLYRDDAEGFHGVTCRCCGRWYEVRANEPAPAKRVGPWIKCRVCKLKIRGLSNGLRSRCPPCQKLHLAARAREKYRRVTIRLCLGCAARLPPESSALRCPPCWEVRTREVRQRLTEKGNAKRDLARQEKVDG